MHEDEESAARQYDRALLIEKGRAAKTNFPLPDYEKEANEFETFVIKRYPASDHFGLQLGPELAISLNICCTFHAAYHVDCTLACLYWTTSRCIEGLGTICIRLNDAIAIAGSSYI